MSALEVIFGMPESDVLRILQAAKGFNDPDVVDKFCMETMGVLPYPRSRAKIVRFLERIETSSGDNRVSAVNSLQDWISG